MGYIPIPLVARHGGSETTAAITSNEENSLKRVITGIAIAIAVLLFISVVLYYFINRSKKRKYSTTLRQNPMLRRGTRKLKNINDMDDLERQRMAMIRKSLATRSTASSRNSLMSMPMMEYEEDIPLGDNDNTRSENRRSSAGVRVGSVRSARMENPRRVGLKEDWKEFEANMTRDRSNSGELHPSVNRPSTPRRSAVFLAAGNSYNEQTQPLPTFAPTTHLDPYPVPSPPLPPPGIHPALANTDNTSPLVMSPRPAYVTRA